jgi:hypothetical protein
MILTFIPAGTKIYALNNITYWWRPITVKAESMVHEIVKDIRECAWNVMGFTVYKVSALYIAIENSVELIHEYIPW